MEIYRREHHMRANHNELVDAGMDARFYKQITTVREKGKWGDYLVASASSGERLTEAYFEGILGSEWVVKESRTKVIFRHTSEEEDGSDNFLDQRRKAGFGLIVDS